MNGGRRMASMCTPAVISALSKVSMNRLFAALVGVVILSGMGGASPLTSTVTVPDGKGGLRGVVFQGQADGATVRGTVYVDLDAYDVTGTIGDDGSVSG